MSLPATGNRCPGCGKDNACGLNSQGACWCATEFAPRMPLATSADAACYCRDCLRKLMDVERLPADAGQEK